MKDELRNEITNITHNVLVAPKILSLLAPVLADAEKWRKVKEGTP